MDIQTVTVELLRAGPRHNQLLSPITQYLGVCGNSAASRVTLPYEHGELERQLHELRYGVSAVDDPRRASHVLERIGRQIAEVLSGIEGVAGMLNPTKERPNTLTHLRIVMSASELAMLPFEASKVPAGPATSAGSVWLALQGRAPVCITRHIRSVSAESVPWPVLPRVLFIAGPDTPVSEHKEALKAALKPWRDANDSIDHLLEVLDRPRIDTVTRTLSRAVAGGKPFTHVHVLAHGTQMDEYDRYSPVGLVFNDGEEPVTGQRLATTLTAIARSGASRPTVVTLASCESARQVDVHTADAAIAHDLHDHGIPLVVASQFPLTVPGSVPFVARFYEGQLRGEHPLVSLYEVRMDLHRLMDADTHDWASLVVYEALPPDLPAQLEEVRYWQARRAQEGALERLEALAGQASRGSDSDRARKEALASATDCVADLPSTGPYALECAGLRGGAYKRIAQTDLKHAIAAGEGTHAYDLIAESRRRLNDARTEYWRATKAFLGPSSEAQRRKSNLHWLLGQVISLDVVLGQPLDTALLTTACLAAQIDLETGNDIDRAWAHVSLAEFELLRLADDKLSTEQREKHATLALEHCRNVVERVGRGAEHVATTARQFDRYASWWGNPQHRWLLARLGIPERPHWHEKHGLVPTAKRAVEVLLGDKGVPSQETPPHGEPPPGQNGPAPQEARTSGVAPTALPGSTPASPRATHVDGDQTFFVEMLPAENGDCLLLDYGDGTHRARVLIDCGAKSTVPVIASRLGRPPGQDGHAFELFVLTHIDADHINGVLSLFDEGGLKLRFDDIWFNGWHQINRFLGVRQGEDFSKLLEDPARKLPWNRAFSVETDKYPAPVVVPDGSDGPAPPTITLPGGMELTLLSPGLLQLKRMARDWLEVLRELDPQKAMLGRERRRRPDPVQDFEHFRLEPLAATKSRRDPSVANGSSIALLAEFADKSVLLAGDAHADVLVKSIGALQRARGREGKRLKIDALKLSHHGSANGTTIPLLDALECRHYLVSSNGNVFYHPDRESIARVILYGGLKPTLHFNYRSIDNELWDSAVLKRRYGYTARYPDDNVEGLRVDVRE